MNEYILLFGLNEEVALIADVTQKSANIQLVFAFNLLKHGIQHDVRSWKTNGKIFNYLFPGSKIEPLRKSRRTSTANSGAAMNDDWPSSNRISCCRLANKAQNR